MAKEWTINEVLRKNRDNDWKWRYVSVLWALAIEGMAKKYGYMTREEAEAMAKLLNASEGNDG